MKENQTHISPESGQPSPSADKLDDRFPYGSHYDSATSPNAQNMRETNSHIPLASDNVRVNLSTDPLSGLDEQNDTGSCTGAEFGGYSRYSNGYTGQSKEVKAKNSIFPNQNAAAKSASVEKKREQRLSIFVAAAISAAALGAIGWLASAELPMEENEDSNSSVAELSQTADTPVDAVQEDIPKTENFVITYEVSEPEVQTASLPEKTAEPDAAMDQPEEEEWLIETGSASVSTPSTPESFILPVGENGAVTQPFSCGELVKSKTLGEWRTHDGIDLAAGEGDEVRSIADGLVEAVANDTRWGNTITVNYGDYTAYYYGLADQISVQTGEAVQSGQLLGKIGNSSLVEASEPFHLHLGIKKDGSWIDPALLLGLDDGDPAEASDGTETDES